MQRYNYSPLDGVNHAPFGANYHPRIIPVKTAELMIEKAREAVSQPQVFGKVRELVRFLVDERVNGFLSSLGEIQVVDNLVRQMVRYTRDPIGVELVYSPQRMVSLAEKFERWSEDCDTQALLTLTFLMALGRPSRVTIASFHEEHKEAYSHVFVESMLPSSLGRTKARWVIVDPSLSPQQTIEMSRKIKHYRHFYP